MKWVIIKGVRYPSSVISAFAAYNMDNPFLKVRIRNKYHIVPFDDVNKMANQMVYLMDNYMKRIVTVQDLINELMLVVNKKAEINVTVAGDGYETEYTPCLYDFSIIDFTDVHPDDGEAEDRVVLQMYR